MGGGAAMAKIAAPLAAAFPLLAGCTQDLPTVPLAGWSRAPDLSVYSSMELYGAVAREQSILCGGSSPARVRARWADDFGTRETAVKAALATRHGANAVDEAQAFAPQPVTCGHLIDLQWRENYIRMLRLLEMRLGLA